MILREPRIPDVAHEKRAEWFFGYQIQCGEVSLALLAGAVEIFDEESGEGFYEFVVFIE